MAAGRSRKMIFLALILMFILSKYAVYQWFMKWFNDKSRLGTERGDVRVLMWHWPFKQNQPLQEDICRTKYHVSGCHLVDNRSLYHQADVVVFHNRELQTGISRLPLDQPRPTAQKWVWLSLESPPHNGNLRPYGGLFNWTMTYRRDADIFIPYGELVPRTTEGNYTIPTKHTLACWVVSNYQPTHKRTKMYQSLKKLIPVEVYGRWAKKPLNSDQLLPTISRCYFYLAFENSVYRDYITEKLWYNAFLAGSVPVVLGPPRANYEAFIPKDSFIHVDDFNSTEKLADFLKQLASDKERYGSYFRWRRDYDVKLWSDWREMLCTICIQYEDLPTSKVYNNLDTWSKEDP
ncbi:alpha-(1,3)-fucosyltransferase 7-like isoform X2 [Brienomyrus brachyistius]|uniref:alpha-(1,3)-fucosyltransferase 7-like isoform X2 n=1 Tax=Brienomyrus brachyistius TaxID=42636 RepID=UPI0020B3C458|nr:alpha-(1,3)-fucosyltransferase 7-like isoform X2 [Brienomyrus brachyistius]